MMNHTVHARFLLATVLLGLASTEAPVRAGQTLYTVTDLGSLGGNFTAAAGINDQGQIVGRSATSTVVGSPVHAFLYSNGVMTDLGTLGGTNSEALSINKQGQIVGDAEYGGTSNHYAFLYSNGTMQSMGTLGGASSQAYSINDSGTAVGYSETAGGGFRAFTYSNGTMSDLNILNGNNTGAFAINNSGQIAGVNFDTHEAFLYSGGTVTYLGDLGGHESQPYGMNNVGDVVGSSIVGGVIDIFHAFLYHDGNLMDLGAVAPNRTSIAYGINDQGQVVGTSETASFSETAFLYSNGVMQDLNKLLVPNSGVTLTGAFGINGEGQIIADGFDANGSRAFLLTPQSVPEPSSVVLGGIAGVMGLAVAWRRGRRTGA
jgi:probable HAF family extracellular repeat protein